MWSYAHDIMARKGSHLLLTSNHLYFHTLVKKFILDNTWNSIHSPTTFVFDIFARWYKYYFAYVEETVKSLSQTPRHLGNKSKFFGSFKFVQICLAIVVTKFKINQLYIYHYLKFVFWKPTLTIYGFVQETVNV